MSKKSLLTGVLLGIFSLLLFSACRNTIPSKYLAQQKLQKISIKIRQVERSYYVYKPSQPLLENTSIVIMLHDTGSNALQTVEQTGWDKKAEKEGFFVIFPEALPRQLNKPMNSKTNPLIWNDGSNASGVVPVKSEDLDFIKNILEQLPKQLNIKAEKIFLAGFGQGGSMAYRVAATLPNRFNAVAVISGHFWTFPARINPPVPLIAILGTEDPQNPLPGGEIINLRGDIEQRPPILESVERWATLNQCTRQTKAIAELKEIRGLTYQSCKNGAEVRYYMIDNHGFNWPGGKNFLPLQVAGKNNIKFPATDLIWGFFNKFQRPY